MQYFIVAALAAISTAADVNMPDCSYGTDAFKSSAVQAVNDLTAQGDRFCAGKGTGHGLVYCDQTGAGVWVNAADIDAPCTDVGEGVSEILRVCGQDQTSDKIHGQVLVDQFPNGGFFVEIGSLGGKPCPQPGVQG